MDDNSPRTVLVPIPRPIPEDECGLCDIEKGSTSATGTTNFVLAYYIVGAIGDRIGICERHCHAFAKVLERIIERRDGFVMNASGGGPGSGSGGTVH
jgi:hypothetical protein